MKHLNEQSRSHSGSNVIMDARVPPTRCALRRAEASPGMTESYGFVIPRSRGPRPGESTSSQCQLFFASSELNRYKASGARSSTNSGEAASMSLCADGKRYQWLLRRKFWVALLRTLALFSKAALQSPVYSLADEPFREIVEIMSIRKFGFKYLADLLCVCLGENQPVGNGGSQEFGNIVAKFVFILQEGFVVLRQSADGSFAIKVG